MTFPTQQQLLDQIGLVEREIQTLGNQLDDVRAMTRTQLLRLNAQRDQLADVLKAVRANLTHLIPPQSLAALGIESTAGVGAPGN